MSNANERNVIVEMSEGTLADTDSAKIRMKWNVARLSDGDKIRNRTSSTPIRGKATEVDIVVDLAGMEPETVTSVFGKGFRVLCAPRIKDYSEMEFQAFQNRDEIRWDEIWPQDRKSGGAGRAKLLINANATARTLKSANVPDEVIKNALYEMLAGLSDIESAIDSILKNL